VRALDDARAPGSGLSVAEPGGDAALLLPPKSCMLGVRLCEYEVLVDAVLCRARCDVGVYA
jgi:hypothetical protein